MNKKYLSVILFSALMLGTTGTFTSCKDYDDDINNLQEQVDKIVADIDALQKAAGSYVTAVKYDAATGKLTVTGGNGETFQLPMPTNVPTYSLEVKDGKIYLKADGSVISEATLPATPEVPAAFNPELLAWGEDGYLYYGDIKIEGVQKPTLNASITEIQKDGEVIGYIITIGEDSAKFYVKTDLKSMVFIPDLYVDGIEAAEYGYLYYPYQNKNASETTGTTNEKSAFTIKGMYTEGIEYDYAIPAQKPTYGEFNPTITVNYNINPTSAKIDEEGLKFINRNVEVISRAAGEESLIQYVSKSAKVENGVLSVGLKAQGSKIASKAYGDNQIESAQGDGENDATIFALTSDFTTMGDRDTIITSDYAMLYASRITPVAIAYNDGTKTEESSYNDDNCPGAPTEKEYELYTAPYRAAEKSVPASLFLAYDDKEGIDLLKKLCLHYTWDTNTSKSSAKVHKVMTVEEAVNTYGMKFEFNLVKYEVGTNKTHDSKYLDPTKISSGKAIACVVKDNGGEGISLPGEQGVSAIGRHPLVQVLVRDSENKIILDGYIKLEIVRDVVNKETDFFDKGKFNFGCTDDETGYAMKAVLTWDEFAYKVLEMASVTSKEEFNKLYKLDVINAGDATNEQAKQFVRTGELTYALATDYIGTIKEVTDAAGGTTTDVLAWTLDQCEMQTVYLSKADEGEYTGSADHAKTVYVRYVRDAADAELSENYPAIYLPITIHVEKPVANVQTRIPEYWYSDNMDHWYGSTWMGGQGIHVNVDQPYDNKFPTLFVNNLNAPWKVWTLTSTNVQQPEFKISNGTFTSYTPTILSVLNGANGGYKYYFRPEIDGKKIKGASGKEYTLKVDDLTATDMCNSKIYTFGKDFTNVEATELERAFNATKGFYTNTKLYAFDGTTKTQIAEIQNGRTATPYQNDPCIEYQNNTVAKDILNAYAHDDKESLTALIGITAYSSCDVVLSLSDNVYPARIQRPVDIEGKDSKTFTDAEANGSIVNIIDLFNFNDWRNVVFVTENGTTIDTKNAWLFAYYNFKSAEVDIDGITTTLGMGEGAGQDKLEGAPLLTSVSKEVKFSQVGGDLNPAFTTADVKADNHAAIYDKVKAGFGKIKYDNNNNNVKEFWVRIPVKFSYQWGDIKAYVDCKVIHTMGN